MLPNPNRKLPPMRNALWTAECSAGFTFYAINFENSFRHQPRNKKIRRNCAPQAQRAALSQPSPSNAPGWVMNPKKPKALKARFKPNPIEFPSSDDGQ
jgi:hypothetical protein